MIKILVISIIFYCKNIHSEEIKIIFSIDEKAYTSIDLNKRIEYIDIVTNNKEFVYEEYLEDYISVLIFNHYAEKTNLNINDEIIKNYLIEIIENYKNFDLEKYNYLNNLNDNKKNFLLKHIKYDYQKKIILEKFLKKQNINKEVVDDQILDLYSIEIIYFSFDKKYENNLNDITRIIKTKDINLIKKELDKKSIVYKENNRKLVSLNNLDQEIKNTITDNKYNNLFKIIEDNNFVLGWSKKSIRQNIDLKYTFFQITTANEIKEDLLKCKNIDFLSKRKDINIKKFEKIDLNKINNAIKTNLNFINDFIIINNNNQKSIIILCNINYNKNLSKQLLFDEKIYEKVKDIENEFLIKKNLEYNLKKYE